MAIEIATALKAVGSDKAQGFNQATGLENSAILYSFEHLEHYHMRRSFYRLPFRPLRSVSEWRTNVEPGEDSLFKIVAGLVELDGFSVTAYQ